MSIDNIYPYPPERQQLILSLLLEDFKVLALYRDVINADYFLNPVHKTICKLLLNLFDEYGIPITKDALILKVDENGFENKKAILKILKEVEEPLPDIEKKVLLKGIVDFGKWHAVQQALGESIRLLKHEDVDEVENTMNKAFSVGKSVGDLGVRYFSDTQNRLRRRNIKQSGIRTLIPELDMFLSSHGLNPGELGVVMGRPNVGKTQFLLWVTKAAALQEYKVVIYSLEMGEDQMGERLDASFSNIVSKELKDKSELVEKRVTAMGNRFGDNIHIKDYPSRLCSCSTIKTHVGLLTKMGFRPDMIVVDYADIVQPVVNYGTDSFSKYLSVGSVYTDLKSLAKELKIGIWTASKARRSQNGKEDNITTLDDSAESDIKAFEADIIVTLNRTAEEEKKERLRMYLSKNKMEKAGIIIPIFTNHKKGSFYRRILPKEKY